MNAVKHLDSHCFLMLVREKIVYASFGVSGTLHERMCGKILNAHVFKMAGKITRFFSSKSGKESQDKKPSNGPDLELHNAAHAL